jgi:hypothetical protein
LLLNNIPYTRDTMRHWGCIDPYVIFILDIPYRGAFKRLRMIVLRVNVPGIAKE